MLLVNFTKQDYLLVIKRQLHLKDKQEEKENIPENENTLLPQVLVPVPAPLVCILRPKMSQMQKFFQYLMSFL